MTVSPSTRLAELGLVLPSPRRPAGNFVMAKRYGDLLFLSGQGPGGEGASLPRGKVGTEIGSDEAYQHARHVTLNLLSAANAALGSIDRIGGIVKVLGFVNAIPEFADHPAVINGCSDLLIDIFGPDRGAHARSAIGAGSLPSRITVEIEMVVSCVDGP